MIMVDGLSRLPSKTKCDPIDLDLRIEFIQFSTNKLLEFRERSKNDSDTTALRYSLVGWTEQRMCQSTYDHIGHSETICQ